MRQFSLCLLLLGILAFPGCKEEKKAVKQGPLVPTRRELEMLQAYQLDPASERGQRKLQKYRERREKLAAARERVTSWAEEAEKRREAEGEEEEPRVPLNGLYAR